MKIQLKPRESCEVDLKEELIRIRQLGYDEPITEEGYRTLRHELSELIDRLID